MTAGHTTDELSSSQRQAQASTSSTASTSRTPFQFAPVPARFRRHLEPRETAAETVPRGELSSRPCSHSSSRRNSETHSVSSNEDDGDAFDSDLPQRDPSSSTSAWPAQPITPTTPMTPMTPLTPVTPGWRRSYSGWQKRSSLYRAHAAEEEEQDASSSTQAQLAAAHTTKEADPTNSASASRVNAQEQSARATTTPAAPSSEPISENLSELEPGLSTDGDENELLQDHPQPRPPFTRARGRQQDVIAPTQVIEQDPFADANQVPSAASEPAFNPFISPEDDRQPINNMEEDRDLEKQLMDARAKGGKAEFDESFFPDYAPLVQSRVTAGRYGLMLAIGALNLGLVILFLFLAPAGASLVMMVALKSRDILSVLWQSLLFILHVLCKPFRKRKEVVIHPPRKIVSLVPVYKESTQDVLDTVDSIIQDNPVRPQDFNIIAIMADGFDVEDDVIVQETICRVEDSPYFSWKIRESAFRLQFGFRMGHPIMIVRKVKNAGKKDSLIFAFDLFNSDNEATGHCNSEARAMVLDHIRRLYNQPDLEFFDFVFCTDADTKILAGSVDVLADRLMDEGEKTVGACGIVEADFEKPGRSLRTCGLWYFWDHFQGFQYTYGQWIRRRSESSWGRVTCMPGAITMLRTGAILGQASAEYRKHVQNGNLVNRQVQYQGTDRRLCWSIISRSKDVRTVLETRAACFTIPPQSLSHYLSQRRRWGSNAYFNAFVTLTQQNQHVVTRIWMTLELTRSTLVFFRMYNFAHFVYNLVTKFSILGVAPLLAITLLPQIWFLLFVVIPTKRYRPLLHHLLYGAVLNRLCSIILTPTVYANVLLGFGDFRWGKSHTGANAASQQQQQEGKDVAQLADQMEKGESRPCTPPKDQTEVC
ncbi:hypothetical protein EX895_003619 [Sporisorium graminicola]|uniref:chitin synthase n=1 Tax=Sporisorium graminicola TaxID=280036 RepID=A0A4U7KSP5_9BASI|nr:hypothetical protein EX895_003619 [Sporisorium graminicola]TKY87605.1 hypothetical protein EX895_003619 [Sporisorium graminicola]